MHTNSIRSLLAGVVLALGAALIGTGCSNGKGQGDFNQPDFVSSGPVYSGKASWYSIRTNGGRNTASGEPLSNKAHTAAHKSLPMGTRVRVTNLRNGRSEIVRITDRGPYIRGRIIDVTVGVAEKLNMVNAGVVPVKVEVLHNG